MPRFFLPESQSQITANDLPQNICLEGEDAFHLSVSLRARIGDEVMVCTATGLEILCSIQNISGGKKAPIVRLSPISAVESKSEAPVFITLYQGMPKGKKTDSILQKCTELGVGRVVFVYTDRSVPKFDDDSKKLIRYEKIAQEAAKQCGRGKLVTVGQAQTLDLVLEEMKQSDVCFACYENENKKSIKEYIGQKKIRSASFFIGPEGGISDRELALLQEHRIPTVSLGGRILRTETASSAVLSMFLYQTEL